MKLPEKFPIAGFMTRLLLVMALLGILLAYTLPWVLANAGTREYSGIDFHGYWYAGHYTRAGTNPYWAIMNRNEFPPIYWDPRYPGSGIANHRKTGDGEQTLLELPIQYLDGTRVANYPVAQLLIVAPGATAPLTLFMGLFSWLSWPTARSLWLLLNVVAAALIPWLGFRLLRGHKKIDFLDQLIIALAFYNFYGLRQCLVVGQQSLISLFLLLLALLFREKWLLAGILLGFGLSKYSVGLPFVIFFLLQKEFRIVIVALVVQMIGVAVLMPLAHGSVVETAMAYLKVLDLNYSQEGIHLLARFPQNQLTAYLFMLALLIVLGALIKNMYFPAMKEGVEKEAGHLNVLNLLTICLFLVAYHRIHDMPFMLIFFLPVLMLTRMDIPVLLPWQKGILTLAVGVLIALLIFPTLPYKFLLYLGLPADFASENAISTLALLLMLFTSIWMQFMIQHAGRQNSPVNIEPA